MTNPRVARALECEQDKLDRALSNIDLACEAGRISEHDRDERQARIVQQFNNRVAYLKGEPRPRQRNREPLDDPQAGVVG